MANNYLQFSEVIPNLTTAEEKWLRHQLEGIAVIDGSEYPYQFGEDVVNAGDPAKALLVEDAEFAGCRAYRDLVGYDHGEHDCGPGFQYSFDDDHDAHDGWGRHMWLYADKGGGVDLVAHLVQKFLREFRPKHCWSLTYATTCSRSRVGEFGGGAVFVTARSVSWDNAYEFIAKRRAKFAATEKRRIRK